MLLHERHIALKRLRLTIKKQDFGVVNKHIGIERNAVHCAVPIFCFVIRRKACTFKNEAAVTVVNPQKVYGRLRFFFFES